MVVLFFPFVLRCFVFRVLFCVVLVLLCFVLCLLVFRRLSFVCVCGCLRVLLFVLFVLLVFRSLLLIDFVLSFLIYFSMFLHFSTHVSIVCLPGPMFFLGICFVGFVEVVHVITVKGVMDINSRNNLGTTPFIKGDFSERYMM